MKTRWLYTGETNKRVLSASFCLFSRFPPCLSAPTYALQPSWSLPSYLAALPRQRAPVEARSDFSYLSSQELFELLLYPCKFTHLEKEQKRTRVASAVHPGVLSSPSRDL